MATNAQPFEIIDAKELASRWKVPTSWVYAYSRERTPHDQRIPHVRFGPRYVRYEWNSPQLEAWIAAHRSGGAQ